MSSYGTWCLCCLSCKSAPWHSCSIAGMQLAARSHTACAGCIPLFIGPPWHALPLNHMMHYGAKVLFFNVTGPTPWIPPVQPYRPEPYNMEMPEAAPSWAKQSRISFVPACPVCLTACLLGCIVPWSLGRFK